MSSGGSALSSVSGRMAGMDNLSRVAAAISGFALLVVGTVAVFVSDNGVGTGALLAAGLLLVVMGFFGNRIQSFEGAGVKVSLKAAEDLQKAAAKLEEAGEVEAARQVRSQAGALLAAVQPVATDYEQVRSKQAPSWERTDRLQGIVHEAQQMSAVASSQEDVERLFATGADGNRIAAIGIMQADPSKIPPAVLRQAIAEPRSAFEQWHSLKAAEGLASLGLGPTEAAALREVVQTALTTGKLGARDSDRVRLATQILAALPPAEAAVPEPAP
jgi:hypothetical protein